MKQVAVVNSKSFGKYFPDHVKRLDELGGVDILDIDPQLSSIEIAEQLSSYTCIIASVTPEFDQTFLENSPKLKLIARHGLGFNNVDINTATEKGVYVTKVQGEVEREAVAEHTLALLMNHVRMINQANESVHTKPWSNRSKFCGIELKGAKVGVIGYGNIGSRVGEILHDGFGAEVLVYDPNKSEEYTIKHKGKKVSLATLLAESDVISLNASANKDNFEMISFEQFKQMKNQVIIVNTARGNLLNQEALVANLENKKVGAYAADVFKIEPIEQDNPLLAFENVVLTPHIGAYTYPSLKGMGDKVVDDVEAILTNRIPKEIVNEGVLDK